jgi:cytochrome o ubiquinol oxidase subunit 3
MTTHATPLPEKTPHHLAEVHAIDDRTTFAFWMYIMSDCLLFGALFATYAVLRGATYGGPTPTQLFELPYVFVETLILLTSSFTCGLAILFAHQKNVRRTVIWLSATLALGIVFVGMEVNEFSHLVLIGAAPSRSAFLSAYFTLVGTHGLHVTLGAIWILSLIVYISKRGLTHSNMRKLIALSLFWHFLDIVWILIFTIVYLFGVI